MKRMTAFGLILALAVAAVASTPRSFFNVLVEDPGLTAGTPEYDAAYAKARKAAKDVQAAKDLKAEADALQDEGRFEAASAKYAQAAKVHPQSLCRASILFAAGASLVSKPGRPFMYDVSKTGWNDKALAFYAQATAALQDPDPYGCGKTEASTIEAWIKNATRQIELHPAGSK